MLNTHRELRNACRKSISDEMNGLLYKLISFLHSYFRFDLLCFLFCLHFLKSCVNFNMTKGQDDEESLISKENDKTVTMGEKLKIVEFVIQIVFAVLSKFWKLCTSAGLILLLTFWYYGGVLTLVLLVIGGFGTYELLSLL